LLIETPKQTHPTLQEPNHVYALDNIPPATQLGTAFLCWW